MQKEERDDIRQQLRECLEIFDSKERELVLLERLRGLSPEKTLGKIEGILTKEAGFVYSSDEEPIEIVFVLGSVFFRKGLVAYPKESVCVIKLYD